MLGGLHVTVNRNYFGRQTNSFETLLTVPQFGDPPFPAVFIRAPAITEVGAGIDVLATLPTATGEVVIVALRQGPILATAFHPELTHDPRWHQLFIEMVRTARTTVAPAS